MGYSINLITQVSCNKLACVYTLIMQKKIEMIAILMCLILLIYIFFTEIFIKSLNLRINKTLPAIAFIIMGVLLLKRYWIEKTDENNNK
jgi:uncharacterized membrane-anchored protein